jgi:hypothetical protein
VFDLSILESQNELSVQSQDLKHQRQHAIYSQIFNDFLKFQGEEGNLLKMEVCLGGYRKFVTLKPELCLIIGDMQGGDKICCSSASYSNKMARICRKCNVSGAEVGNPFAQCFPVLMNDVINLVASNDVRTLRDMNQHNVHSAFFDFGYGGCKYGIFTAAMPIEPLHSLAQGIIEKVLKVLFTEKLSKAKCAELDTIARQFTTMPKQFYATAGTNKAMPRLLWKDGITTLTDLSGSHRVGILFTVICVALTKEGASFFDQCFGGDQTRNMIDVFQMLLCYWQWLKKKTFWRRGNKSAKARVKQAIQTMLQRLVHLWPQASGQGWDLAKVHEQLHVPDDIERNGAPENTDSTPTEHNHINIIKKPAMRTQRIRLTLDKQIANQLYETDLIKTAMRRMNQKQKVGEVPTLLHTRVSPQAACANIEITYRDGPKLMYQWRNGSPYEIPQLVVEALLHAYSADISPMFPKKKLVFFTELLRNGEHVRAHPNYRGQGHAWYDWIMFRWERSKGDRAIVREECYPHFLDQGYQKGKHLYAPGQVLGFVLDGDINSGDPAECDIYVIARTCKYSHQQSSVFSTRWQSEWAYEGRRRVPSVCFLPADSMVRQTLLIPCDSTEEAYFEVWNPALWPNCFCEY